MKILNLLLIILPLISGLCLSNAFAQANALWGLPSGATNRIGKGRVNEIKYFPDGTKLAVASTIGIWIYNVQTGEPIDLLTGHTGPVNSIAFSPDGTMFATASDDNTVWLWDTNTGEHRVSVVGHTDDVNAVSFSPDGQLLATASDDDTVGPLGSQHRRVESKA